MLHSTIFASFNGRFMTDYGTSDIDYVHPYFFDRLCIIAPKALQIPKWIAVFKCFSQFVWLILFLIICLCGWFWFFLKWTSIKYKLVFSTYPNDTKILKTESISIFVEERRLKKLKNARDENRRIYFKMFSSGHGL